MNRYYSTQRPVGPGTYPAGMVESVTNFENRKYCEEIGREAWGYVEYGRELSPEECEHWELVKAETVSEALNEMFERLVPGSGAAKTVAGEIVRAICRIGYRYFNDGDHLGIGYGRETCNPAGRYLAETCDEAVAAAVNDAWEVPDDGRYEAKLAELEKLVLNYLRKHPELEKVPNKEDMWNYRDDVEDVDNYDEEEDY